MKYNGYEFTKCFSIIHRYSQIYILGELHKRNLNKCHPPVLMTIYLNEGLSQNQLASCLRFNKGAVAKVIRTLTDEDYIKRVQDPCDKRINRLYLTEKSKKLIPQILEMERQWSNYITDGLSENELEILHHLLNKITDNLIKNHKQNTEKNNS